MYVCMNEFMYLSIYIMYIYILIISPTLILAADWSISLVYWTVLGSYYCFS